MGASRKTKVRAVQFQGGREVCLLAGKKNTLLIQKKEEKILKQDSKQNKPDPTSFRHPPIEADYAQDEVFQGHHQAWTDKSHQHRQAC